MDDATRKIIVRLSIENVELKKEIAGLRSLLWTYTGKRGYSEESFIGVPTGQFKCSGLWLSGWGWGNQNWWSNVTISGMLNAYSSGVIFSGDSVYNIGI